MIAATNRGFGSFAPMEHIQIWYHERTEYTGKLPYIYCLPTPHFSLVLKLPNQYPIFLVKLRFPRIGVNALGSQLLNPNRGTPKTVL